MKFRTKPLNILFIVADDFGWRDMARYGSTFYETPHLDRLAREGAIFTDAYAACPVCSPSRASLMTGKYPARLGVTNWIDWGGTSHPDQGVLTDAPYRKGLPEDEVTIAAALREGGYQTWHVGKWHLGGPGHLPEDYGFDINVGGCEWGCPSKGYFAPWQIPHLPGDDVPPGTHLTDHLTDRAIALLRERDPAKPFFLNLWHYDVHTPLQAKPELLQKYEAKAKRLKLDQVQAVIEGESFPFARKANQKVQRRVIQSHPAYAAMIDNLDSNIGRLLGELDRQGLTGETLVVYTSDNGGLATAEGSPTSNLPLAEGKGWMNDGGIREPLIVRWPGVIRADSVCRAQCTSTDFYPTFLEAAGLPPRPEQHPDGRSLVTALAGDTSWARGPIYWHYPHYGNQGGTPAAAVRDGDWKLIRWYVDERLELYNLADDIGECRNRAADEPERARAMSVMLADWLQTIGARFCERTPVTTPWKTETTEDRSR